MYYVYRKTLSRIYAIAECHTEEQAIAYMEHSYNKPQYRDVVGYSVESYDGKTLSELEF
jgi:RPA family protein